MGLFIVRHQHQDDRCPAKDPDMGARLLNHLSRATVRQHGVELKGEAVVQDEHALYMIIEADAEDRMRRFLDPFTQVGTLDIFPASTCARVVASGGCAAPAPPADDSAVDPKRRARRPSKLASSSTGPIRSIARHRSPHSSAGS
jgi:hypothetical protein